MNVIAMVAAQHLAVAAHQEGAAIGWSLIVAIPSAIVAMIGILAYIIGVRRPFDITDAQYYWKQHSPPTVGFRCVIRNRSPLWDRTVTRLAVVEPDERPSLLRWPRYHDSSVQACGDLLAAVSKNAVKVLKQDVHSIEGELSLPSDGSSLGVDHLLLQAYSGRRSSRPRRMFALVKREEVDAGAKLLLFVDDALPSFVDYVKEMALSPNGRRRELCLRLQERVLSRASRVDRRVTLSYADGRASAVGGSRIVLRPEWGCPGWGSKRAPLIDDSTARGRSVLNVVMSDEPIRVCRSRRELDLRPDYMDTARDAIRFPAYALIPMVTGQDSTLIGLLEVESKDELPDVDAAELIAMASVLTCAKLLDAAVTPGANARA